MRGAMKSLTRFLIAESSPEESMKHERIGMYASRIPEATRSNNVVTAYVNLFRSQCILCLVNITGFWQIVQRDRPSPST